MRKPGSLDYLKRLSDAVLSYAERWRSLDEQKIELPEADEKKRAADWKELVDLAGEIREALGDFKKARKRADQHLEG